MDALGAWNGGERPAHARPMRLVSAADDIEVLVAGVATEALLDTGAHTLIIPWSGVPRSVAALCAARPHIKVHNLHHNAAPVAEHAIGMLLAAARRLVPADRGLRTGDWRLRFETSDAPLINGRRALILGAGAIATRIARAAEGLGMHATLLGSRPRSSDSGNTWPVLGPESLDDALTRADVLFVTLPLTPATDGLLDARRLALLPQGALLVNVGRGPVIDERALFDALATRHLAGAGLDVWYTYPQGQDARAHTPPSAFPFGELDHVVLSPHRAGHGTETERLCAEALFGSLAAAARGRPIPNPVDPTRGY